ncbi:MAG: BamA/TamA family outer membrane protein [Polyangiaceae bacterium]|nr:BamA/TamA family outer membrane protein [Polyangiaceae bacterium]
MTSRLRLALAALALGTSGLSTAGRARAESAHSAYEQESIDAALRARGQVIDPAPEGKTIEGMDLLTLPVFEERDPAPGFLNGVHVTTRWHVIERELLFATGDRWQSARVEESARNLRELSQLSLVLIVPVRGTRLDRVRALVITKDVWSLRLDSYFEAVNGRLTTLLVRPAETNVAGTHATAGVLLGLGPDTYVVGLAAGDRRIAGSRLQAIGSANLIANRATGDLEGSFGWFYYGRPLWSLEATWGFDTLVAWRDEIFRRYVGTRDGVGVRRYDSPATPEVDDLPWEYASERLFASHQVVRSFGRAFKHDLGFGVEADRRAFRLSGGVGGPAARDFLRDEVPVGDTRVSPYVQLHAHTSEYRSVLDFNTLGLQEDYKLGHDVYVRIYPAAEGAGSTRTLLGLYAAGTYTVPLGDGLARALVAVTREEDTRDRDVGRLEAATRIVTPRLGFGRFVHDTGLVNHWDNHLNERLVLGGDSRLRGFAPFELIGDDVVASNLELRTSALDVLKVQVGGVLFHDAGGVADRLPEIAVHQSVGVGLRLVFPQFDRAVVRIDWGFPLEHERDPLPGAFYATVGQAFEMPLARPPGSGALLFDP